MEELTHRVLTQLLLLSLYSFWRFVAHHSRDLINGAYVYGSGRTSRLAGSASSLSSHLAEFMNTHDAQNQLAIIEVRGGVRTDRETGRATRPFVLVNQGYTRLGVFANGRAGTSFDTWRVRAVPAENRLEMLADLTIPELGVNLMNSNQLGPRVADVGDRH